MAAHRLTVKIVLGMTLGVAFGVLLNAFYEVPFVKDIVVGSVLHVMGGIFVKSLKMLVVPLVFVSLACGIISLDDIKKLGSLGGKTMALYLGTTALAIGAALSFALLFQPGVGFNLPADVTFSAKTAPSLSQIVLNIVPSNPFQAAVEASMLQIIFFAILFGIGVSLAGDKGKPVASFLESLNTVIMELVKILMQVAPYGVFALIAKVFASQGFEAFAPLLSYFGLVIFCLVFHGLFIYPIMLKIFSGLSPKVFFKKFRSAMFFAFSTASSNATLPVTLRAVIERLGVNRSVASFTIPLGATINMDGTAIMQGVATAFIAQAYGIEVGLSGYLMVIVTATLASIGTAGVPGVGLITLAMVLRQVGLPIEGIGLIMGVDRLLDMLRTALNVYGDATVSCIVAKSEGSIDEEVYYNQAA